jgi:surface antigen
VVRGDVAIFDLGRYWHVAYVENVRRDHRGNAISIDISEKNYGPRMTPDHYRKTWGSRHGSEWEKGGLVRCDKEVWPERHADKHSDRYG